MRLPALSCPWGAAKDSSSLSPQSCWRRAGGARGGRAPFSSWFPFTRPSAFGVPFSPVTVLWRCEPVGESTVLDDTDLHLKAWSWLLFLSFPGETYRAPDGPGRSCWWRRPAAHQREKPLRGHLHDPGWCLRPLLASSEVEASSRRCASWSKQPREEAPGTLCAPPTSLVGDSPAWFSQDCSSFNSESPTFQETSQTQAGQSVSPRSVQAHE